jgi:hypothetical protein
MSRFIIVLGVTLALLGAAQAAPMMCSSEQRSCLTACQKNPPALIPNCISSCRAYFNYCRSTGCWDNGISRYCGLLRQ